MERTDTQLVSGAASGDSRAFAELVRRYRGPVYGYCFSRTGSFEDARDLCQDTFVRAYGRLGQLREPEKLGPWLRSIAGNLCTRWAQSRREEVGGWLLDAEHAGRQPSAPGIQLGELLSRLPENERVAVILHYAGGLSYAEAAEFLGISEGAFRGRLHRGREKLRAEVLEMAKDAIESNQPDEESVLESVEAAVVESRDAYNMRGDKLVAWRRADEAAAIIDELTTPDVKDPSAVADALLDVAGREVVNGSQAQAEEHLRRAKRLFEESGDAQGIERWRAATAYMLVVQGHLKAARELFEQAAERSAGAPDMFQDVCRAAALALASVGDVPADRLHSFQWGSGSFRWDDDDVLIWTGGFRYGVVKGGYPAHMVRKPDPPLNPIAFPLVLMRLLPSVGDTLYSSPPGCKEGCVVESATDTIATPAGEFTGCIQTVTTIICTDGSRPPEIRRTIWYAPGVGMVKNLHEEPGQPAVTAELVAFGAGPPTAAGLPFNQGDWWTYRWAEGEERHGYRTEIHRQITHTDAGGCRALHYFFCVAG